MSRERITLLVVAALSGFGTVAMIAGGASGHSDAVLQALRARQAQTVSVAVPAPPVATTDAAPPPATDTSQSHVPDAAPASTTTTTTSGEPAADAPASTTATPETTTTTPAAAPPDEPQATHVEHVFVIALNGPGITPELQKQGAVLSNVKTLGSDVADRIALISGQPPNAASRAGCTTYKEIGQAVKPDAAGVISADGCVYPNSVVTLGDRLTADGRSWRAYVEDIGRPCRHPASDAPDDTINPRPGDAYAVRHNPFVYFHSLLDLGGCDANDVGLDRLEGDLHAAKTTPALSYVAPNLCDDGTAQGCGSGPQAFLATWVPKILAAPAYKAGGALLITYPGGALALSRYVAAGTTNATALDAYALSRAIADLLAVKPLARAAKAPALLDSVFAAARIAEAGDD